MRVQAYALRHQKAGVLTDTVFIVPPTDAEQAAAKARLDRLHSTDGWLRVVPVVLVLPDTFADIADRFAPAEAEAAPEAGGVSGVADISAPRVSIVASVVNP